MSAIALLEAQPLDIRYWVGATDDNHEGDWRWTDNTPVAGDIWWPGEPNDAGWPNGLHENCAAINYNWELNIVALNDLNCTATPSYFICEKGIEGL